MFDKDKRALLLEAVFACGLIAIGIPTGQVPLLAIAASAAAVGGNWAHNLADRGFHHWSDGWFTDEGVLNHDIQKALCEAYLDAVKQLEHDWKPSYEWLRSNGKTEEAESTLFVLRELREEGSSFLLQPKQHIQGNQQQSLLKRVEEDRVLSFLYSKDEFKTREAFKSALRDFLLSDDYPYTHNSTFVTFVTEQLGPQWILRFVEILKDPKKGTPAWRACQLLWQKSLMASIGEIQRTTAETADAVRWLKEWGLQLKSQPPTQRDTTGQEALKKILDSVGTQLGEIQAATERIEETTRRTDETAKRIEKTAERIERRLKKIPKQVMPADMTPQRIWHVPYLRNPYFTGREVVLEHVQKMLSTDKVTALTQPWTPPQALSGLGGIGKTQIAVEYAHRFRNTYHCVFWMSAASRETLIADFVVLAGLLNLPQKQEQDQMSRVAEVKKWLDAHDQWLLIFDNADDLEMAYEFLPTGGTGYILLTTRAQATGSVAQSIEVEKMERQEGTLLLLRRARVLPVGVPLDQTPEKERAKAEEIVLAMDGLPLALDQAGAYIEETRCSLSEYLDRYRQREFNLLHRRGGLGSAHPDPVATTWFLSFEQVEQQSGMAADLLRFCAFLFADTIPEEMIVAGATQLGPLLTPLVTDQTLLDDAIAVLRRFSLVRRNSNEEVLFLHRLVQVVLRGSMNEQTQHEWAKRTVRAINQAFPSGEFSTWPQCERYLPHALTCANLISQYTLVSLEAGRLLHETASYLFDRVLYEQAEPLYQRALAICEQRLGPEHPTTATVQKNYNTLVENMKRKGEEQY